MLAMVREYETRAARYFRLETIEVAAESGARGTPGKVRKGEGMNLKRRLPDGLETWALTRNGAQVGSREFADSLSDMATYGRPGVAFLIGGAFGLDEDLVRDCTRSLSLSRMTLTHEMARLVLVEQIYRAGTILRGEPYHKGEER